MCLRERVREGGWERERELKTVLECKREFFGFQWPQRPSTQGPRESKRRRRGLPASPDISVTQKGKAKQGALNYKVAKIS